MVLQIFESFPWMSSRSWECVLQTELHLTITATLEGSIICILHVMDLRIRKVWDKSSWIWHLQMIHIYLYCCSVTQSCLILQPHGLQASLSTISLSSLKLMSIELVMPSNHLILLCCPLLPSIFSSIRVFSNESALHIRWPKYWSLVMLAAAAAAKSL